MNQNMHTWLANVLIVITIMIIQRKSIFTDLDNEYAWIFVSGTLLGPIIFFGIWFYIIS